MADFCKHCADKMGIENYDIDIDEIFNSLKKDEIQPVLCEGCTMNAVAKNLNNKMELHSSRRNKWYLKEEFYKNNNYF